MKRSKFGGRARWGSPGGGKLEISYVSNCKKSPSTLAKSKELLHNPISPIYGGLAQLGERLHGMQEVSGSIPLSSTKTEVPIV